MQVANNNRSLLAPFWLSAIPAHRCSSALGVAGFCPPTAAPIASLSSRSSGSRLFASLSLFLPPAPVSSCLWSDAFSGSSGAGLRRDEMWFEGILFQKTAVCVNVWFIKTLFTMWGLVCVIPVLSLLGKCKWNTITYREMWCLHPTSTVVSNVWFCLRLHM